MKLYLMPPTRSNRAVWVLEEAGELFARSSSWLLSARRRVAIGIASAKTWPARQERNGRLDGASQTS